MDRQVIVVDTSVWIAHLHDRETPAVAVLRELPRLRDVVVGDIVLMEVLNGARTEGIAHRIATYLSTFSVRPMGGPASAVRAAHNYRELRRLGISIRSAIDCLIATYCIDNGHSLLHQDRDFEAFERHLGLRILR